MEIVELEASRIDVAMGLVEAAGWNQVAADWLRLLKHPAGRGWLARYDGQDTGTVTTIEYGQQLAWIGMMLVDPKMRRRGVGKALMAVAIRHLRERGVKSIRLDATPAGRLLYEPLGFRLDCSFSRWLRPATGPVSHDNETTLRSKTALNEAHWQLDRLAFGADRSEWLETLRNESNCVVTDSGFGMLRPGRVADYLGPVVCEPTQAESIITALIAGSSRDLLWDLPANNPLAVSLAEKHGFKPVRELHRMTLGEHHTEQCHIQFALADLATG